jgi:hypothetical protein
LKKLTLLDAVALVQEHDSVDRAWRHSGMPRDKFREVLEKARAKGLVPGYSQPEQAAKEKVENLADKQLHRLRAENTALKAQLKTTVSDTLTAEEVRESIFGLAEVSADPPSWLEDTRKAKSGLTGVPVTIWSDWHLGEVVQRHEVNGVNEFNLDIADARIRRLVNCTIDLCFSHMTNPEYPGIVVALLGDILSGELHPEHAETNELDISPQILWSRDRIIWALQTMADVFKKVFVPVAPGNHGRDPRDRRPRTKRYVYRNFDWLLACLVEQHFKDVGDDRIQFFIPPTGEARFDVYGHRYMGIHGDDMGVKGGDGIIGAIGPIMRGEIKMRHSQAQIDRDYDTLIMGHWHQTLNLPRAIVNNSLKGYDEFARRVLRAPAMPPSQSLWFNHPKHGITARWEVFLNERRTKPGMPWASWETPKVEAFRRGTT